MVLQNLKISIFRFFLSLCITYVVREQFNAPYGIETCHIP